MVAYKEFWQKQAEGLKKLQTKGPYKVAYFYYDSPKVVGLKNVEGEISLDAIDVKEGGIAYTTFNKASTKGFTGFMAQMREDMKEAKNHYVATVENKKKEEEQKVKSEKVKKFLKENENVKKN